MSSTSVKLQNSAPFNRQWTVAERPVRDLELAHFGYRESAIAAPKMGEVLLKTHYLNLAPVMRMYMMENGGGYGTERPLSIGDVIHGRGVAQVIASQHPEYQVGDFLHGQIGWQTHKVTSVSPQEKFIKMSPRDLPIYYGLSALGMTGYSAYCGFVIKGMPRAGDGVLISGAAGGVGSLVVQIAKVLGCHPIVGIAGGAEKCEIVKRLGADAAIDYKSESVEESLSAVMPERIDVYFDNVGGEILEAAIDHLSRGARVVLCGAISEYARKSPFALRNYGTTRHLDADLRGFFVYNHTEHFARAETDIASWIKAGQLEALVDIDEGFENMPQALMDLYGGKNKGKRIVKVTPGEHIFY